MDRERVELEDVPERQVPQILDSTGGLEWTNDKWLMTNRVAKSLLKRTGVNHLVSHLIRSYHITELLHVIVPC